jgi:hypothetical protein
MDSTESTGVVVSKESLLKKKVLSFYKNKENLNTFLSIILQKTRLSLRSIDWFVTNYCKKYNINYSIKNNNESLTYFPFKAYKLQLKAYSKKFCDPFCRRERVIFDYKNNKIIDYSNIPKDINENKDDYIITTIGQLNFFKFAIQDKIIDYALENINSIESDMNNTLKNRENEKKFMKVESIKRKELSVPGNKSVHITRVSAIIKFT